MTDTEREQGTANQDTIGAVDGAPRKPLTPAAQRALCLLYTSDAADE